MQLDTLLDVLEHELEETKDNVSEDGKSKLIDFACQVPMELESDDHRSTGTREHTLGHTLASGDESDHQEMSLNLSLVSNLDVDDEQDGYLNSAKVALRPAGSSSVLPAMSMQDDDFVL